MMASAASFLEAPIPKPVLWVGTPIAALVLISIFVFLGFPYDPLADTIAMRISEASGTQVTIGELEPRLTIAGPGFAARNVTLTPPRQETVVLDKVRVRPAWSLKWLSGAPTLHLDVGSQRGNAHGDLSLGRSPSWDGELTGVDLASLPLPLPAGASLAGRVDADIDLTAEEGGPVGTLSFEGADGIVSHPRLPVDLEFDTLRGSVLVGGDDLAQIEELELRGPILVATAAGRVSRGNRPGNELLDIAVKVEIENPGVRSILQQTGMRLDANGRTELRISGTTSNPRLR